MANSFKQMKNNGTLKRTDSGMFIKLADIHVQEGFNKRADDERTQAADDDLFNHLSSGKPVPPLEVRPHSLYINRPEYRCERLHAAGALDTRVIGEYPDLIRQYRKKESQHG